MKNKYCCKRMKKEIKDNKYLIDVRGIYYHGMNGERHDVNFCIWCGAKQISILTKKWRQAIAKNADGYYTEKGVRPNIIYNPIMTKADIREMMKRCFEKKEELDKFMEELVVEGAYIFGMKIKLDENKGQNEVINE